MRRVSAREFESATALAASFGVAAFSISATRADPTTAASAIPPSTDTCSGDEIPKPTASGSFVKRRTRRASAGSSSGSEARSPVTPVREIKYRNPVEHSAISARRASVDVGAARKIVSKPRAVQYGPVFDGFFRRQIRRQDAVRPGRARCIGKFLDAHLQNRIEIAEENQRNLGVCAKTLHKLDHAREGRSAAHGAFARALNRRSVGDRIAERHAQLDHVRACLRRSQHDFLGRIERRIARGDIGDETKFAGRGKLAKAPTDSPLGFSGERLRGRS